MEIVDRPAPPSGLTRLLWRLPIHLYRLGLGRLLGSRFMLLHHVGRFSGRHRRVVIEVVHRDDRGHVAVSGFGTRSDWYRNVRAHPDVVIQTGGRTVPVRAERIPTDEAAELMAHYAGRHPRAARRLCAIMGFSVDGSAEDYREVARHLPFIRFTPR